MNLISDIANDIQLIKGKIDGKWFDTHDGRKICLKIISIATNGEHAEKIERFAHALINSSRNDNLGPIDEKFKFVDILKIYLL